MKTKLSILFLLLLTISSCGKPKIEDEKEETNTGTIIGVIENNNENENKDLYIEFMEGKLGNVKCTTHIEQEGGVMDQIMYISGIRMYMKSDFTYKGNKVTSYIISDGEYNYVWGNGPSIKMKIDEEIDIEQADEDLKESDELYNYLKGMPYSSCEKWDVDENKFKVPEGEFMDITDGINLDINNIEDMYDSTLEDLPPVINDEVDTDTDFSEDNIDVDINTQLEDINALLESLQ